MTKQQKTWAVIIVATILIILTVLLVLKFWQIAIIGTAAFIVGYVFGYKHARDRARRSLK